ncbi:MAG: sulfotransferase [Gemmataceae bacterium]
MQNDLIMRAAALFEAGDVVEAKQICDELLSQQANNFEALHLRGALAAKEKDLPTALEMFEKARTIRSTSSELLTNLGGVYRGLGQLDRARKCWTQAIEHDSNQARAYHSLAEAETHLNDGLLRKVRDVLGQGATSHDNLAYLHFAAGKICDDLDRFEEAFAHFEKGNTACRVEFDPQAHRAFLDRIMDCFQDAIMDHRVGTGVSSRCPIFVVGMPRSGTSLVEQILASHPDVFGAGELPDINAIAGTLPQYTQKLVQYPECLLSLPDKLFAASATAYLNRLASLNTTRRAYVVDKAPLNFLHLGLVRLMFPQAVILHCQRNPMATCLSCFFQKFVTSQEYSFHLDHLGFYYCEYERLMSFWRKILPNTFVNVSYEKLVQKPNETIPWLLDICGLNWDDRCLRPERTVRPVATASAWQVRRPIYTSSVDRWRNYEAYLEPLRTALESYKTT